MEALQAAFASKGGQETVGHAVALSTGGPPTILICGEEEIITYG